MAHDIEPLTSLLICEVTIAASAAGKLSGALWQMGRVLRKHLQPDVEDVMTSVNKGRSGAVEVEPTGETLRLPSLNEPSYLRKEYDEGN